MSAFGDRARHFRELSVIGHQQPPQQGSDWIKPDAQRPTTTTSRQWPGRVYETRDSPLPRVIHVDGVSVWQLDRLALVEAIIFDTQIGQLVASDHTITVLFGGVDRAHRYIAVFYEDELRPAYLLDMLQPGGPETTISDIAVDATGQFVQLKPTNGPKLVWDTAGNTIAPDLSVEAIPI